MPTFIKTGYWEKLQKGYKGWLNLDEFFIGKSTAASAGQIGFFDTSGAITGSDSLFWNNTSSRLGVGLTTPLSKLHIYDNTVGDTLYVENTGGVAYIQTYYRNNNVNPAVGNNIGAILFATYFNSTYSPSAQEVAGIFGVYYGDGTNRVGGVDIRTYNGGGQNVSVRVNNLGNVIIGSTSSDDITNKLQVIGSVISTQYRLSALNTAPASATATGTLGEIRIDANHIYVCTATNVWKRAAIATW